MQLFLEFIGNSRNHTGTTPARDSAPSMAASIAARVQRCPPVFEGAEQLLEVGSYRRDTPRLGRGELLIRARASCASVGQNQAVLSGCERYKKKGPATPKPAWLNPF